MADETYHFPPAAWDRLELAGVPALSVIHVLYGGGAVARRHTGAVLQIAGQDRSGQWLGVALIETDDDTYTVVGARWLDDSEAEGIGKFLEGEGR